MSAAILGQVRATRLRHASAWRAIRLPLQRRGAAGFTLAELLISVGVLVLLVLLASQLLNTAATVTTLDHKQMDADSQARQLLDRMAVDFAQMVKRSDVDYYLKSPGNPQTGNDQIAFYTASPGYFATSPAPAPSHTTKSPISLVAYRIDRNSTWSSYNRMERLGKGLAWNGFSSQ
jgi:type II secretory pathway pseudopilin PulG